MKIRTEKRNFSFTELCICILLVLLISTLLIPAVNAIQKEKKNASCEENVRKIAQINALYQFDNNGFFPVRGTGFNGLHGFMELLAFQYIGISKKEGWYGKGYQLTDKMDIFVCPDSGTRYINSNYSYNCYGLIANLKKDSNVRYPKTTMLSSDLKDGNGNSFGYNSFYNAKANPAYRAWSNRPERHSGRNFVVFVDGHVESVDIKDPTSKDGGTPKRFIGTKKIDI